MNAQLDTDIHFLITVPDWQPEYATPLQGFSLSLCENTWMIRAACFFPSNIYDLTEEGIETFLARRVGGVNPVNWYPQSPRAVKSMPMPAWMPFTVVLLGKGQEPGEYTDWVKGCEVPPTIVAEKGGHLTYQQLNLDGLQQRFLTVCDAIPNLVSPDDVRNAKAAIKSWKPLAERKLGYQVGGHATVTPNLMALSAAGFTNTVYGRFGKINQGSQPYIDQIVTTSRSVFEERERIGEVEAHRAFRRSPDLNIFAPAIYPGFFSSPVPDSFGQQEKREYRLAKNILARQSEYGFEVRTDPQMKAIFGANSVELSSGDIKPKPHFLLLARQMELALGTDCIGALTASEISAVIRPPNDINRTAGIVRQFASHYRSENTSSRRRLLAFRSVQARLAQAFPPEFYEFVRRSQDGIRIVADTHIEWLDIDGLPLGIRKNVSRIPVTPGNLFVEQVTAKPPVLLTPEDFHEVLVISALKRDDPIRRFFQIAFEQYGQQWKDKLNIKFTEVSNERELVSALNKFSGALVVFDGHGSHNLNEPAYLHLMDCPIDTWELRGKIERPPPIVVLSACDTHAADRSHATAANGFLAMGSRAVLGSVFPLNAIDAAVFAARLLYRVSSFVPAAISLFGHALTWTEIVSGMLRMQLLTNFLRHIESKNIIMQNVYFEVHEKGNMAINSGHEDPFQEVASLLIAQGVDEATIKREMEMAVASSSVISYLNMGRPETILIDTESHPKEHLEELS